jgi:hypothetical protein
MGRTTDPPPSSDDKLTMMPSSVASKDDPLTLSSNQEPLRVSWIHKEQNNEEHSMGTPGAVHVIGMNHAEEEEISVGVGDMPEPAVVAHLAPDAADIEALITEQVENRVRQRDLCQTIVPIVSDNNIIVIPADKVVSTRTGLKKRSIWIMTALILIVFGGVVYWLLVDNRKDKQMEGSEASSQTMDPVAGTLSPVLLDPLIEELRFWIAPTDTDLATLTNPTSPQSQALAWLQDDPITLAPGRSTRTVLERYALAVLYYTTWGPSWQFEL